MSGKRLRPRILFINHWARSLGGAEYSLIDILKAASVKARVGLVTSEQGALVDSLKTNSVHHLVVPCASGILSVKRDRLAIGLLRRWWSVVGFFRYVIGVAAVVHRLQPDCIHANVPKSHMTLFCLLLMGYRGAAVVHMRELFPRGSLAYNLYRIFSRLRQIRVIAISQAVRDRLPPELKRKATVVYNGVYIPEFCEKKEIVGPIRFLYLGRIVPWKGCHRLIEVFGNLRKKLPPDAATLRLVGATSYWECTYRTDLEALIKQSSLEELVVMEDKTDNPYDVLKHHHVLCLPSDDEPFGRVAVEAQGCGLPVIGFSGGGLTEIIINGETGRLIPRGDMEGFAAAMANFVHHPGLISEQGKNGYHRAEMLFNREIQVPAILSYLFRQISPEPQSTLL
ncbi:MAG: glycosyltransferase family 4 protein [Chitinispirillaceae bacterium]|nr:glycosyltransferase family 4 protein [Chitinispirillaceae bacterium]